MFPLTSSLSVRCWAFSSATESLQRQRALPRGGRGPTSPHALNPTSSPPLPSPAKTQWQPLRSPQTTPGEGLRRRFAAVISGLRKVPARSPKVHWKQKRREHPRVGGWERSHITAERRRSAVPRTPAHRLRPRSPPPPAPSGPRPGPPPRRRPAGAFPAAVTHPGSRAAPSAPSPAPGPPYPAAPGPRPAARGRWPVPVGQGHALEELREGGVDAEAPAGAAAAAGRPELVGLAGLLVDRVEVVALLGRVLAVRRRDHEVARVDDLGARGLPPPRPAPPPSARRGAPIVRVRRVLVGLRAGGQRPRRPEEPRRPHEHVGGHGPAAASRRPSPPPAPRRHRPAPPRAGPRRAAPRRLKEPERPRRPSPAACAFPAPASAARAASHSGSAPGPPAHGPFPSAKGPPLPLLAPPRPLSLQAAPSRPWGNVPSGRAPGPPPWRPPGNTPEGVFPSVKGCFPSACCPLVTRGDLLRRKGQDHPASSHTPRTRPVLGHKWHPPCFILPLNTSRSWNSPAGRPDTSRHHQPHRERGRYRCHQGPGAMLLLLSCPHSSSNGLNDPAWHFHPAGQCCGAWSGTRGSLDQKCITNSSLKTRKRPGEAVVTRTEPSQGGNCLFSVICFLRKTPLNLRDS